MDNFKIYKNDIKFNDNLDFENTVFDSEDIKNTFTEYNKKSKIEFRITDSEIENYEYFDLSNLNINDNILLNLMKIDKIKNIFSKIIFLDLSSNKIKNIPNLEIYSNIKYLNISNNFISGEIIDNNLIELSCDDNKITKIISSSITKLSASNNNIEFIDIPNINVLIINKNKLLEIKSYCNLEYLECICNKLQVINNLINLQELYIANNNINDIDNMPKLLILNCTKNPINKIKYFENLNMIICSTPLISKKYNIKNINKVENDYFINV